MLELGKCGASILCGELVELLRGPGPAVLVDHDPAGDRERPGAEVLAVLQIRIRAQCAEERLLERVLGAVGPESASEEREDLVAMLLVEVFERRHAHLTIF